MSNISNFVGLLERLDGAIPPKGRIAIKTLNLKLKENIFTRIRERPSRAHPSALGKSECVICGETYEMHRRNAKTCSLGCAMEMRRKNAIRNKRRRAAGVGWKHRVCVKCGKEYTAKNASQLYCSTGCAASTRDHADHASVKCAVCGSEFVQRSNRDRYCGRECRKKQNLKNSRKQYDSIRLIPVPWKINPINCLECGKKFHRTHKSQVCCCGTCQNKRNKKSSQEYYRSFKERLGMPIA